MTKRQLVDEIMRRARYNTLSTDEQARTRDAYMGMRKSELEKLITHAPATWDA